MTSDFVVDDIDRSIVDQLRLNGRATNQQIADHLGLTATTVSSRIRRMEDANQLRVVAVSDFSAHGYNVLRKWLSKWTDAPRLTWQPILRNSRKYLQHTS